MKTKAFFPLFCMLFFSSFLCASACNPIVSQVGTNIWQIMDSIQAAVCGPSANIISQADVPIVISTSGKYCLCEDITTTVQNASGPITVSADHVFIDLNHHRVSKPVPTDGSSTAIITVSSSDNVHIFNGQIVADPPLTGTFSGSLNAISVSSGLAFQANSLDIVNNNDATDVPINGISLDTNSGEFLIVDCTVVGCGIAFQVDGATNGVLRRCVTTQSLSGVECTAGAAHVMIIDCTSQQCLGAGFTITNSSMDIVIKNCKAVSCDLDETLTLNSGFVLANSNIISVVGCEALFCNGTGFSLLGGTINTIISDCIAQNCQLDGFSLALSTSESQVVGCKALNNGRNGFINNNPLVVTNGADNNIFNCFARGNGMSGSGNDFALTATQSIQTRYQLNDGALNFWHNFAG